MAKNWIQNAIKRPGALKEKAKEAGKSITEYCNGANLDMRTRRQCALAKTLKKFKKQ